MFGREASKQLRQKFWISFGKSFPKKWVLYQTKTKGLALKFHFNTKTAMVSLDVAHPDMGRRMAIWDRLQALKTVLKSDYLPEAIFDDSYLLDNQKEICRIYIRKEWVSIHDKNTWRETMLFLNDSMLKLEAFYMEYREIIVPA